MEITRRNFVKSLGLGALAGFTGCASREKVLPFRWGIPSKDAEIDCLVLGAGMSGITSARYIVDEGMKRGKDYNVVVLEGANRIGGRIQTFSFNGDVYEMGAGYIHREKNTVPLWNEINKYNIPVEKILKMDKGLMYHPKFGLKSLTGAAFEWNIFKASRVFDKVSHIKGKDLSAIEFLEKHNYHGLGYDFVKMILTGHVPMFPEELSMKGFSSDNIAKQLKEKYEYRVSNGLTDLLEKMSDGLDARLDSNVREVNWMNPSGNVAVTLDDGQVYHAKSAVCSFSIGMLKSGKVKFSPELPWIKREALKGIKAGNHSKMILKFKKRFWPEDVSMIHRADSGRREGMTYFNHNCKLKEDNPTLVGLLLGHDAEKMAREDREVVLRNCCKDLDDIFPEAAPTLDLVYRNPRSPHNGAHPQIWKNDEFALGGNAGLVVNPDCNVPVEKVRETLADARMVPGLFFAGEAMAIAKYLGGIQSQSIHGAHASGLVAAESVVEYLENGIILDPKTASKLIRDKPCS